MNESILGQRILVVDPDPARRELLQYLLVSDGHQVDEAQGRSQALTKLHQGTFDVVLTGSPDLEVNNDTPFPRIELRGESTPVLKISDDPLGDPAEELSRFLFNPFDLVSIRQALAAIRQMASVCPTLLLSPEPQEFSPA